MIEFGPAGFGRVAGRLSCGLGLVRISAVRENWIEKCRHWEAALREARAQIKRLDESGRGGWGDLD
jgi:hypothetical protein